MFYESTLKPACVIAALCWVAGWLAVAADLFTVHDDLGHVGLGFMAAAVTLQIRGYYLSLRKRLDDHQLAFDMGKEVAQQGRPRPVR